MERSQCGVPPSVREIGAAVGLKSVSYTPLDVYKRQKYSRVFGIHGKNIDIFPFGGIHNKSAAGNKSLFIGKRQPVWLCTLFP